MAIHVAVDIGGTFTDLVAIDEGSGRIFINKSASSNADPISAIRAVFQKTDLQPDEITRFVHGTTVATNALIERDGTRVGFVTNRGFRDVLFIQDGSRRDLYSLEWKKPKPLVARYDCLEVGCRIDSAGNVAVPLGESDLDAVVSHLRAEGIRSVAIGLLFSYMNSEHELALEDGIRAAIPDVEVSLSHRLYPRWRENDRWQTVVADAYLKRMFSRYISSIETGLKDDGAAAGLVLMKSNGGVVDAKTAASKPVNYLVSGPVGGVLGGVHFAALAGLEQIMTIDIGGTSSDVCLIPNGEIPRATKYELAHGIPIKAPQADITTIGAGGGSIGWVDAGGLLRVGPRSAGSTPGPACYGRGGREPTIVDANLVLGRLNPGSFCGGEIRLDRDLSIGALEALARVLGQEMEESAKAMLDLATHDMADALRLISVNKGIDPRDFALVAFGGAGGLHATDAARVLGMTTVLIPPYPGNTSAYGLLTAGRRSDLGATLLVRSDAPDIVAVLNSALAPLRERCIEILREEGSPAEPEVELRLEMRYYGQNYHREITIAPRLPLEDQDIDAAVEAFHADYEAFYGYMQPGEPVEVVGALVTATSALGSFALASVTDATASVSASRPVHFGRRGFVDTEIVRRESLHPGYAVAGPQIIEEALSTTIVPPDASVTVHDSGSLLIELKTAKQ